MTPARFRTLVLALPDVVEASHHGHPDFRVGGRIFASLNGPDLAFGMALLAPEEQEAFVRSVPDAFTPFKGAWGRRGCTKIVLAEAPEAAVRAALAAARGHVAATASAKRTSKSAVRPKSPPKPRRRPAD